MLHTYIWWLSMCSLVINWNRCTGYMWQNCTKEMDYGKMYNVVEVSQQNNERRFIDHSVQKEHLWCSKTEHCRQTGQIDNRPSDHEVGLCFSGPTKTHSTIPWLLVSMFRSQRQHIFESAQKKSPAWPSAFPQTVPVDQRCYKEQDVN